MLQKIIDNQYRRPTGLLGSYIGAKMARDHQPENLWTIAVLNAQPTDHILELGFGAGVALQRLTQIVTRGRIEGVDYSRTMVRLARKRNASAIKRGQVVIHHGDVIDLSFDNETFDKVYSIHCIYFWRQPTAILQSVLRVLKPGGTFTLTILPRERWNADDPNAPVGTPSCRPYSSAELQEMLSAVGFAATRLVADTNPCHRSNYCVVGTKG